jgi:hypothetical protein
MTTFQFHGGTPHAVSVATFRCGRYILDALDARLPDNRLVDRRDLAPATTTVLSLRLTGHADPSARADAVDFLHHALTAHHLTRTAILPPNGHLSYALEGRRLAIRVTPELTFGAATQAIHIDILGSTAP